MNGHNLDGFICLNKPRFLSSFDVVQIVKKNLGVEKAGHTGTLDPLAQGLLIILLGRATKLFEKFLDLAKEYSAQVLLGVATLSYDADSQVVAVKNKDVTAKEVARAIKKFQGEILQKPPVYSAVHWQGQRLYQLARAGIWPKVCARKVKIYKISLEDFQKSNRFFLATLKILSGRGVYIRSIANDLGKKLKVGGFLYQLTRTKIGDFSLKDAVTLEDFLVWAKKGAIEKFLKKAENFNFLRND